MVKAEWGKKCTCASCGARFYDLKKKTIACPKCGEQYKVESAKPKRSTVPVAPAEKVAPDTAAKVEDGVATGDRAVDLASVVRDAGSEDADDDDAGDDAEEAIIEDTIDVADADEDVSGMLNNVDGKIAGEGDAKT